MLNSLMCGVFLLAAGLPAAAQEKKDEAAAPKTAVNSLYERGPARDYALKSVYVGGEVENPGPVALASLPLRDAAVKELGFRDGKPEFRGAYFFTGYSLYDILKAKPAKKVNADFSPEVDLYVVVENDRGDKAVFSWGEIYYARNGFGALIYKSARSVTAPKSGDWALPGESRLVCANDLYDTRFISEPTRITVKSVAGVFPGEKHAKTFVPEFRVVYGGTVTVVADASFFPAKRDYLDAGYGHGTGYKGIKSGEGYLLKDALIKAGARPQASGAGLVVVSARDAYRASFSLSEIINRGDNQDVLVVDKGKDEDGRFALYAPADFFIDRNVRSVDRVEVIYP